MGNEIEEAGEEATFDDECLWERFFEDPAVLTDNRDTSRNQVGLTKPSHYTKKGKQ